MIELEVTLFLCLLTSERGPFRALKMRPVRQVLLLARHAPENASRTSGGCPQSVESAVLRALEDESRTVGGLFRYRISLLYRRSLFFTPSAQKMRRVPQEAFLSTECQFRTVGGGFWYGALPKTHRTWLSGAQKSGWQLPLRVLSTPGRGRGKLPPQRSLAYILVDIIQDTKSRPRRNSIRSI